MAGREKGGELQLVWLEVVGQGVQSRPRDVVILLNIHRQRAHRQGGRGDILILTIDQLSAPLRPQTSLSTGRTVGDLIPSDPRHLDECSGLTDYNKTECNGL